MDGAYLQNYANTFNLQIIAVSTIISAYPLIQRQTTPSQAPYIGEGVTTGHGATTDMVEGTV
mgnify:CR=1 FL=1